MREETGQKGPWQHSERVAWWRNPNRPLARAGATRRADRYADDPDEQLLESRGATDWVHTDPWRVLRIQSEFIDGFGTLAELGPAVSFSDLLGRLTITRCTPLLSAWPPSSPAPD